jgi:hypothetical protein
MSKNNNSRHELYNIPLTLDDINMITRALRNLAEDTAFLNLKRDAYNLLRYVESETGKHFPERSDVNLEEGRGNYGK